MTQKEIEEMQQAMYNVLDNYDYNITFKPGLKTLTFIAGASVVGHIASYFAIKYTAKGLNKLAERLQWETIKKNYHKSQGDENGLE